MGIGGRVEGGWREGGGYKVMRHINLSASSRGLTCVTKSECRMIVLMKSL